MKEDEPTSLFRRSAGGAYRTTIPREIVDAANLAAGDTLAIRPTCRNSALALDIEPNPDESGAHVVSLKMQGPRGRQAVLRPPRRLAAILRLEDTTASWEVADGVIRATIHREPLLDPSYLGGFANPTSTSIVQREQGTYYATLPTEKVRALGVTESDPVAITFDCLRGVGLFILNKATEASKTLSTYSLQMSGPNRLQPRVTVTRALGDGLRMAGTSVDWVHSQQQEALLGRYEMQASI
jgi:bifunctional DNA-binding transcriptional regulator/antitoxin component of YhaV-PrlF toxin-antitoxin module